MSPKIGEGGHYYRRMCFVRCAVTASKRVQLCLEGAKNEVAATFVGMSSKGGEGGKSTACVLESERARFLTPKT